MLDLSVYSGWGKVSKFSAYRSIQASTVLFQQGVWAQSVTIIESGWVKLVRLEENGQEQIIALYPPGSLLGAETLISDQYHSGTAIALTYCNIYLIPAPVFLDWVKIDPQFSWQLHKSFSQRITARDISSAQSRSIPSRLRLEQLLWQLLCAQNRGEPDVSDKWWLRESKLLLPLQRQELAQLISVTPEYLSRLLGNMEKDGVIRRDGGWLIIQSPEGLWRAPEIKTPAEFNLIQPDVSDLPDIIIA